MIDQRFWSIERAAGFLLILGFVAVIAGALMFFIRGGLRGGTPPSPAYFVWERSFIMAAVVLTAISLVLLDGHFQNTDGRVLARAGATVYLFGGILVVAAEALNLNPGQSTYALTVIYVQNTYALMVIYVVLAFLAQAAIGGAVLQAGSVAAWIGWVTIIWNIAWLAVLPMTAPRAIYFPVLHHVMPLVIGIALLLK